MVPIAVKNFSFAIEINGLDQFLVQEITGLSKELGEVVHGGAFRDIKNPGRPKIGDVTLKKVMRTPESDRWAFTWLDDVANTRTGRMALPPDFKKTVIIKLLRPDRTTQQSWVLEMAWPKKVEYDTFNRLGEDNIFETVVLSVEDLNQL